jgi:hypothetical protein
VLSGVARLKSIGPWLWEMKYLWLALAVNIGALALALRPHASEQVIRLTGLVLQLLGIATVAWGISETRALFGHQSLVGKWRRWIARFPLLRQNTVLAVGTASVAASGGKARGYGTVGAGPNAAVEARVDALEQNVKSIHERISATQKEMDEEFQKAADTLKHEVQSRKDEDEEIRKKLEATGTGGVHISAIGASWLFVGVTLSTAAVEIAKCLN